MGYDVWQSFSPNYFYNILGRVMSLILMLRPPAVEAFTSKKRDFDETASHLLESLQWQWVWNIGCNFTASGWNLFLPCTKRKLGVRREFRRKWNWKISTCFTLDHAFYLFFFVGANCQLGFVIDNTWKDQILTYTKMITSFFFTIKKRNISAKEKGDASFASHLPESPLQDTQANDSNLLYTKIYLQISTQFFLDQFKGGKGNFFFWSTYSFRFWSALF